MFRLAGVILMSFLNNFQMTQEILLKNEGYHKGFYMIFEDLDIYKGEVYDRKVLNPFLF